MRLGMIVRCDTSGLGHQTWDLWKHLQPHRTIIAQPMRGPASNLPQRPERYGTPGDGYDQHIGWDHATGGTLDRAARIFRDVDIVLTCETMYDPTLHRQLERQGVATVIIANPELYSGEQATAVWSPTAWMNGAISDRAGKDVTVVPHPVPVERFPQPVADPDGRPRRIVHPTATAMGDRNGTGIIAGIEPHLPADQFTVDYVGPATPVTRGRGRIVDEWWERDVGAWVSVIPRRYGGLCLPALEAFAAGVPVIMPRCAPQDGTWPVISVHARRGRAINTKGGLVRTWNMDPGPLRSTLLDMADRPGVWAQTAATVRKWAWLNRWEGIEGQYWDALACVTT